MCHDHKCYSRTNNLSSMKSQNLTFHSPRFGLFSSRHRVGKSTFFKKKRLLENFCYLLLNPNAVWTARQPREKWAQKPASSLRMGSQCNVTQWILNLSQAKRDFAFKNTLFSCKIPTASLISVHYRRVEIKMVFLQHFNELLFAAVPLGKCEFSAGFGLNHASSITL